MPSVLPSCHEHRCIHRFRDIPALAGQSANSVSASATMDASVTARPGDEQSLLPPPAPRCWEPRPWNESNQRQLRSALSGACKRMPHNAEAHFHMGLLHMRNADGEEALRAFQRAKRIFEDRERCYIDAQTAVPQRLTNSIAKLRAHTAQAAHLAAATRLTREERAPLLDRLQKDLIASSNLDSACPNVWNALALLHLSEGGYCGARDVLRSICDSFPEYLDAWNNLGLSELALGNEEMAVACFQKVILSDRKHAEAFTNYGVVLLRRGLHDAAMQAFRSAISAAREYGFGLSFAWGGLAVAHVAVGNLAKAEEAALEAERTADPVSRPRYSVLLLSIRARRISNDLRRGEASDGRSAAFVPLVSALVASPVTDEKTKLKRKSNFSPCVLQKTDRDDTDSEPEATRVADESIRASADDTPPETENATATECDRVGDVEGGESGVKSHPMPSFESDKFNRTPLDPRPAIDSTVVRLRCVARELRSTSANTALGAVLRLRHDYLWDETGNRNFGAECAERLVEALEGDDSDASAWVQLALLQMGTGEYSSARDFAIQAVSRIGNLEAGWNALGVSYELNDELEEAAQAFEKAYLAILANFASESDSVAVSAEHIDPAVMESAETDNASPVRASSPFEAEQSTDCRGTARDGCDASVAAEEEVANDDTLSNVIEDSSPTCHPTPSADNLPASGHPVSLLGNDTFSGGLLNTLNRAGVSALAPLYNNIGNLKRQQDKSIDEILPAYEKSLSFGGESPAVYNNMALMYISKHRMEEAEKLLSHALTIAPHFECAVSNLLKLKHLRGQRDCSNSETLED